MWFMWFIYWFMIFLTLASLVPFFSRRMQIWILIKKTSGIEVSCLESWERKAKRQTEHSCTNSSNHVWRGQTCAALAKKAGFEDEGKAWWTIWLQDVSSCYFCAGSIMPTFFSKSTTAQTEEKYQNKLIQIQHYSYLQLPPPIRRFFHKPLTSLYNHINHISLLNETSPIDPLPINTGDASRAAVLPRMLLACSVSVVAIANCFCCYCCNGQKSLNK